MTRKETISSFLRRYYPALLLGAALFAVFYLSAYRVAYVDSDYIDHGRWALAMTPAEMLSSFYDGSERLWHILVRLTNDYLLRDPYHALAAITALADTTAFLLAYAAFEAVAPEKTPRWLLASVMFTAFIAAPITLPGGSLYVQAGGLNTWHNPTNIMVRPFAAAVLYMTVRIYNRRRSGIHSILANEKHFVFSGGFWHQFREPVYTRAELILYPLCILFSVYSKPSFLQFFAPAILIFLLIDVIRTKGMLLPFCLKLSLSYIPAAFIMLAAIKGFFPSGISAAAAETAQAARDAGISVYFLKESFDGAGDFLRTAVSELRYFIRPCAFVLFILLAGAHRQDFRALSRLAGICLLVAFLESWVLHESGARSWHGNFLWSAYLASWLTWTAAAGEYVCLAAENTRRSRMAMYVGTPLLLWHLVCGIAYIFLILRDGFYYI